MIWYLRCIDWSKFYRWFTPRWWYYLLDDCKNRKMFWCRVHGHKDGMIWFNPNKLNPDTRCRNCGEDIG